MTLLDVTRDSSLRLKLRSSFIILLFHLFPVRTEGGGEDMDIVDYLPLSLSCRVFSFKNDQTSSSSSHIISQGLGWWEKNILEINISLSEKNFVHLELLRRRVILSDPMLRINQENIPWSGFLSTRMCSRKSSSFDKILDSLTEDSVCSYQDDQSF